MSEGPVITKKRFIAGAVCPACSEPDKLMMWNKTTSRTVSAWPADIPTR